MTVQANILDLRGRVRNLERWVSNRHTELHLENGAGAAGITVEGTTARVEFIETDAPATIKYRFLADQGGDFVLAATDDDWVSSYRMFEIEDGGTSVVLRDQAGTNRYAHGTSNSILRAPDGTTRLELTNGQFSFYDAGTESLRADTSGNLHIAGNVIYFDTIAGNDYLQVHETNNYFRVVIDGTEEFRVDTNGDIHLSGDQIFFDTIGGNDYIQMPEGSNYFRVVLDGGEDFRVDSSGFMSTSGGRWYGFIGGDDWIEQETTYIRFVIANSEQLRVGTGIGGSYGTVQTYGTGKGSYEGYNINGHWVFMSNASTMFGIYDDAQNRWVWLHDTTGDEWYNSDNARMMTIVDGNTDGGSGGTSYVGFNNAIGGGTGTGALFSTTTLLGTTQKRLYFNSSKAEGKADMVPWSMSDDAYLEFKPSSFLVKNMFVDDDGAHHHWDPDHAMKEEGSHPPPEHWVPLRRYGLMWEDLMSNEDHWPIATEMSWDVNAMATGTASVVQRLIHRMRVVETALGITNTYN